VGATADAIGASLCSEQSAERSEIVSDSSLAKLVVTFVVLIGLAFWLKAEREIDIATAN
jgi:hypothetical protein